MVKNRIAFTLAEVLIVLAIIGVVATLTIPSLMQSAQDKELKTAWKKSYAELNQATLRIMQDNGSTLKNVFDSGSNGMRDKYISYLNYTKSCDSAQSVGICWHSNSNIKSLNGSGVGLDVSASGVILNNGSLVRFYTVAPGCSYATYGYLECAHLTVDVNGFKGPNTMGKDIFWIHISEKGAKPWGMAEDVDKTCDSLSSGYGCSIKYLME